MTPFEKAAHKRDEGMKRLAGIVITCVKQCTTIDQLKVLRRLHAGNGPVQSAIITRTRELHQEAIFKSINAPSK